MVFSRTKLLIEEDVLKPINGISLTIACANPKKVYEEFGELIASAFAVPEAEIQEKKFVWNQKETFSVDYEIARDFDDLSYMYLKVKLKGAKGEHGGSISVDIEPYIRTEYPQDTVWQKTLFYEIGRMLADRIFYEKKRAEYLVEIKRLLKEFERRLRIICAQAT